MSISKDFGVNPDSVYIPKNNEAAKPLPVHAPKK